MAENTSNKDPLKIAGSITIVLAIAIVLLYGIKSIVSSPSVVPTQGDNITSNPSIITITSSITMTFTDMPVPTDTITPTFTDVPTSTNTMVATFTDTPSLTFIATDTSAPATYTLSPFPSPIVGPVIINGPPLFRVEGWVDHNPECGVEAIIYGLIISHGTPPYTFTFWSQNKPYIPFTPVIKQIIVLKNSRNYVEFVPPIVIVKGKYKHVEFTFLREDGKQVTWIDDLFYLSPSELCHN